MPGDGPHPRRDEAREHGGAEADERDGAREHHGGAREQHGAEHGDEAGRADRHSHRRCGVVSEAEHVEPAREQERRRQDDDDERRGPQGGVDVELGQRSAAPREEPGGVLPEQDEQHRGAGVEGHRERRAGEDQPGRARARRAAGEGEHERGGREPADERDPSGGPERQGEAEGRDRGECEVRSRGHGERVGGGELVARDGLQQRAGGSEREADGDSGCEAGEAGAGEHVAHGHAVHRLAGAAGVPDQIPDADTRRALREVPRPDRHHHDQEGGEHRDPAGASAQAEIAGARAR